MDWTSPVKESSSFVTQNSFKANKQNTTSARQQNSTATKSIVSHYRLNR